MFKLKVSSESNNQRGKLFPMMNISGEQQMAADVMLLEKAISDTDVSIALRFYNWQGFWISIGKNQNYLPIEWRELVRKKKVQIVRRPTGGSSVLHGGGLTYALIWLSPPRKRHEAYYLASQWLIKAFNDLGLPLNFGKQLINPSERNCFATSTAADLIDPQGNKRIGSAQLWKRGHVLQHGEILLDPPPELWMEVFKTKAPKPAPSYIPRKGLDKILHAACCSHWSNIDWELAELTKEELTQISKNAETYSLINN